GQLDVLRDQTLEDKVTRFLLEKAKTKEAPAAEEKPEEAPVAADKVEAELEENMPKRKPPKTSTPAETDEQDDEIETT
ncbi:MAG: hypothetical protein QF662_05705, partial [Phycisphaerae bacterium]|nr:hypothetical protein [Phycisphaerae bacterium]